MTEKKVSIIKVNKCNKCECCMFEEYPLSICKDGKTCYIVGQSTKRLHDLMNSCPGKVTMGTKLKEHRQQRNR